VFYTQVDDFAMLDLAPFPIERTRFDQPNMWIQVETGGQVSPVKQRVQSGSPVYVVPFWTAIINVDSGIVTSITWDDGCYGCSGNECIMETCGVDIGTCWSNGVDCSLKVYVCWFGTDSTGYYLTSAGKRLSQFREYSIDYAFNSATQTGASLVPSPPQFSPVTINAPDTGGNFGG